MLVDEEGENRNGFPCGWGVSPGHVANVDPPLKRFVGPPECKPK